jgi:tyrosyl-tRNA synthetase
MNFIEELQWREMISDSTPGVDDLFKSGAVTGYIGFDPTAPSLTIGNFVQVMLLDLFQRTGNHPIVLMGGATGMIGDPSFKNTERELKSPEELWDNVKKQMDQMRKFLDFDSDTNPAILVNNYDFYKDMNILVFLRDIGKTLTVNYMASKDSVKKRMETGISFTEFSYQLLQGNDFQLLFEKYNCRLQMGGSDQWGNITAGTEFIRRNLSEKAYAVTTPLLTKADGTKFGKSEQGNIWLDPEMTNPFQFYQFWINSDDADIPKFLRYFSRKNKNEIEALDQEIATNPNDVKRILAEEITARVHSEKDLASVKLVTELLYGRNFNADSIHEVGEESIRLLMAELPHLTTSCTAIDQLNWIDFLTENLSIFASKGEARRALQGNAIQVNRRRLSDAAENVKASDLLLEKYIFIENGKKHKYIIELI